MPIPPFLAALPWKWIGIAVAVILMVSAAALSVNAYGDARFDAGVSETDAKWEAAAEKLQRESELAGAAADEPADDRAADFSKRITDEKERLDDAEETGSDPFDVLFGG